MGVGLSGAIGRRLAAPAALLALALAALALPTPALGAETASHPFLEKVTGGAGDPGQRHPQEPFEDACGVAKDSNGYLYVSDYHHDAVDIFTTGFGKEFVTTIGEVDPGNGPCGLAVDGAGDLYVNTWREDVIELTPSSYPPGQFTEYTKKTIDKGGTATGLALDPSAGLLFADDGTYISEYDLAGNLIRKIGEDPSAEYFGMAVNEATGNLYVADAKTATVKVFGPAGEALPAITGAGTPQHGFAYLGDAALAVDNEAGSPSYGHLFVSDDIQHGVSEHPEAVLDEFNAAGDYRSQIARWLVKEEVPPGSGFKELVEHWLTDAEPSGLALSSKGEVLITNGNTEGSVLDVFGPTAKAQTLTVAKTGEGAGTVISKPAGIDCGEACAAEYDEGQEVKLTATPDAHSAFKGWTGCDSVPSPETCRVTMSAAKAVRAEFEALPQQTLTVAKTGSGEGKVRSEPVGIECPSACTEHFNEGSTVTLTAAPAPHSKFVGWSGPACNESTQLTCQITMAHAESVSARFEPIPPETLALEASGEGSVISEPAGISCPGTCEAPFDSEGPESAVTLIAAPATHYRVAWTGCASEPSPDECKVTMSEARSVKAAFSLIQRTLTVKVAGGGSVSAQDGKISACGATCAATYSDGEIVTLSASAAPGYEFAGWSGGPCGGTGSCEVALEADTMVTANFAALPPPPPPTPRLSLGRLSVKGASASLEAGVSGPGTVVATGRGLTREVVNPATAGSFSMRLALSAAGRRALRKARNGRLAVEVTFAFTPSNSATTVVVKKAVIFGAKPHKPKGHRKRHRGPRPRGEAALSQSGDLFASFNGGISPARLPRHRLAPITVSVDATVATVSAQSPPAVRSISIAVNRHGRLDTRGLPRCREGQIEASSSAQALAVCGPALVGEGSFVAGTNFPEQTTFPSHGRILAFNSILEGHQAILAHVFGTDPVPITRVVAFHIRHARGAYGTILTASLPAKVNPYGYLKRIELNLYRRFRAHGRLHSYLSAACAVPAGFRSAVFAFAHTSMSFADGRTLASTIDRSCKVRA